MPSRYFASEPKADVSVVLRNPKAMDSAKNQVMFALNDYLAGIALDQLSNQAAAGGISFSTNANNGLMLNANGIPSVCHSCSRRCWRDISAIRRPQSNLNRRNPGMRK
jgi:secreted Zn-dependent insulinase-like peptidase